MKKVSYMKVFASAPGRICLYGEHMDWCRKAVIATAIDMRIFILAEDNNEDFIDVRSYSPFTTHDKFKLDNFNPLEGGDLRYVRGVFKAMINKGYKFTGTKLRIIKARRASKTIGETKLINLPAGRGLSSSAALSVAVAGALHFLVSDAKGEKLEADFLAKMADIAYISERKILGINCGEMDQYTSALGNVLYIDCSTKPAKPTYLKPRISLPLVIGDTRQTKNTPMILSWLGKRFAEKDPLFVQAMKEITKLVEEAREELSKEEPNLEKMGELMNLNQYYLKEYLKVSGSCPVSPNRLDNLINAALKAGALGAKLSGSGGGGAMIALCKPENVTCVAKAIREAGGDALTTAVARDGLKVKVFWE